jgi:hypothetical protein
MNTHKYTNQIIFFAILIAVLAYRCLVLVKFGFEYTDSDQAIMWQGLQDYSNGDFHEPRFYGQAYNSMLEAFFAIPLYKLGVSPHVALPIITSAFTLFPFLGISIFAYIKKRKFIAPVILSIPILMPLNFAMVTSLSRGFIPGVFLSSIGLMAILYNLPKKFILFGFFAVLGFSANPNSVILTIPVALYLFWENKTSLAFYLNSFLGIIIGGAVHIWINSFYQNNPNHTIHSYKLQFSFADLLKGVSNLDANFNQVTPLFWKNSFILLLLFFILGVLSFYKKRSSTGVFLISVPLLIVVALGINKVHDGYDSIFFSKSRMFLAFPVVIAFGLTLTKKINFRYQHFLFVIPAFLLIFKVYTLEEKIIENTAPKSDHVIGIKKVEELKQNCEKLNNLAKEHNVDLIIIVNSYEHDFINYGCRICENDFPKTLRPSFERRTWRLEEDENKTYKTILILDFKKKYKELEEIDYKTFLVKENKLKTMALLKQLNIECRKF